MLASQCSGAYGVTGFCKMLFEVVDIFDVGMTMEVVHIFRHHDGADGLGNVRGGVSVGYLSCLCLIVINYHF